MKYFVAIVVLLLTSCVLAAPQRRQHRPHRPYHGGQGFGGDHGHGGFGGGGQQFGGSGEFSTETFIKIKTLVKKLVNLILKHEPQ